MFGLLRKRKSVSIATNRVPNATRVYAVGDVHGCRIELESLLAAVAADVGSYAGHVILVFVGDLVDRGPDSAGVVDRLMRPLPNGTEIRILMGNHEEAMLAAYDGTGDIRAWLNYGGLQTLESYGIDRAEHFGRGFDLLARMRNAIPEEHIAFLRALPDQTRIGDYLFVHAGIRPGVPIEQQKPADLRWIRNEFLSSDSDHGVTVVHGHTIAPAPQDLANRIGIDTGCYAGGPLTALVLEDATRRFLQVPGFAASTAA